MLAAKSSGDRSRSDARPEENLGRASLPPAAILRNTSTIPPETVSFSNPTWVSYW